MGYVSITMEMGFTGAKTYPLNHLFSTLSRVPIGSSQQRIIAIEILCCYTSKCSVLLLDETMEIIYGVEIIKALLV